MSIVIPNKALQLEKSGDGWLFYYEGQKLLAQTSDTFTTAPDGGPFKSQIEYRVIAQPPNPNADPELHRLMFNDQGEVVIVDTFYNPFTGEPIDDSFILAIINAFSPEVWALIARMAVKALTAAEYAQLCAGLSSIGCTGGGGNGTVALESTGIVKYFGATTSVPPIGGGYYGSHENAKCTGTDAGTGGWLLNTGNLNQMPEVDIYLDDSTTPIATVQTFVDRQDVADRFNSTSNIKYGWYYLLPDNVKKGKSIKITAKVKGTNYTLNYSPKTTDICPDSTPTVQSRYIVKPSPSVTEGGMGMQLSLMERMSSGPDRVCPDPIVWGKPGTWPSGVTLSASGIIACADGAINESIVVTASATVGNDTQITTIQVINTGCTRTTNGYVNVKLIYNFIPSGSNTARLFTSLDDACNTMGAYYDGTGPGTINVPYLVQVNVNYEIGTPVWYLDGNDCTKSDDGIRYSIDSTGGNTQLTAILIVNGLIADKKASTYSTSPVVPPYDSWIGGSNDFSDDMPEGEVPFGYITPNGGSWDNSGGLIRQVGEPSINESIAVIYTENGSDNRLGDVRVLAKIRPVLYSNTPDNRIGVGLNHHTDGSGGFNFIIRDNNTVGFMYDHVAFGPTFPFASNSNTFYWFALACVPGTSAGSNKYIAKIWPYQTAEPSTWPYQWDNVDNRQGYPALILGNGNPLSQGECDEWYYAKQVQF